MMGSRSRGGCSSCRQKRRKCDETKPTCNTCKARGIQCGGYQVRLMEFKAQGSYDGQMICKLARDSSHQSTTTRSAARRVRGTGSGSMTRRRTPDAGGAITQTKKFNNQSVGSYASPAPLPSPPSTSGCNTSQSISSISHHFTQHISHTSDTTPTDVAVSETLDEGRQGGLAPTSELPIPKPPHDFKVGESAVESTQILSDSPHSESSGRGERNGRNGSHIEQTSFDAIIQSSEPVDKQCDTYPLIENEEPNPLDFLHTLNAGSMESHSDFLSPDSGDIWQLLCLDSNTSDVASSHALSWAHADPDLTLPHLDNIHSSGQESIDRDADQSVSMPSINRTEPPEMFNEQAKAPSESNFSEAEAVLGNENAGSSDLSSLQAVDEENQEPDSCISLTTAQGPSYQVDVSSPFDNYLYSHFFSVVAPGMYPMSPESNPYRVLYGKIASNFPPLRAIILSASAVHLNGMGQLPPGVASLYLDASHMSFESAIKGQSEIETLAATLLLSISVECIGSGTDVWTSKLRPIRRLLWKSITNPSTRGSATVCSFLRLQYNWMAAIGRTIQCRSSSLVDLDRLEFIEGSGIPEQELQDQAQWFCNFPDYPLFSLLKQATHLYQTAINQSSDSESIRRLIPDVAELISRIVGWQPGPSTAPLPYNAFAIQVNEIWRQGLLCYVYADICALPSSDPRIQKCVQRGMEALRNLSWMQSIIWPLFMIGVHTTEVADRQLLEATYKAMNAVVHFEAALTVVKFLSEVWDDMDAGGDGNSRWRHIMVDSGIQINLVL